MVAEEYKDEIIKSLGNTIRRAILKRLSQEPCFALQIAKDLGFGQQLISQHLKILEKAELIYSFYEKSPVGPKRKMYALSKSLYVIIDLAPNHYNDTIISFETKPDQNKISNETLSLQKQLTSIEKLDKDQEKVESLSELVKKIDQLLTEMNEERIALMHIRNLVMQNVAEISNELDNLHVRRVLYTIINNPDINLQKISSVLNLREELVSKILKQL
ncbi:MAG: ArsR/SmtB family transcription factor, partial [Promethearchaeota archaeon]